MIRVNVHDAKTNLSRYLQAVEGGEVVVLCRRNIPVAEIHPVPRADSAPRPIGLLAASFSVPASFFDTLPEALLDAFEGR